MTAPVPPYRPVANRRLRAWQWALGIVGALLFVGGIALAAVEFSSGGGAAGLFGGSGLGAFGLLMVIVAKDGEL